MATRKGITLTIVILVSITAVSFLVWLIPQDNETLFVVSDFESHLDGVKGIHAAIMESVDQEFHNALNQDIAVQDYINMAEISSSQINSQIIQLVKSKASEDWHESYLNYIESLKHSISYIDETVVVAKKLEGGAELNQIENNLEDMKKIRVQVESFILVSDESRPR